MNKRYPVFVRQADKYAWPLAIVFTFAAFLLLARYIYRAGDWPGVYTDLEIYLHTARTLSAGNDIYDQQFTNTEHHPFAYGYPPLFAEIIAVVRLVLGDGFGWIVWAMFGVACLFASLTILMRHSGVVLEWKWVVLAFGALLSGRVARADVFHVQPHFILLLLIVLGVHLFVRKRNIAGGIAWAIVFCIKPFTGAMVFGLMRNGNVRAFFAAMIAATIIFVSSFLVFWPDTLHAVQGWMNANAYHSGLPNVTKLSNETLYGTFHRLFGAGDGVNSTPLIHAPGLVPFLALLLYAVGATGIWFGSLSKHEYETLPENERLAQGLLQAAVVLGFAMSCGPLMEAPHMFMMLPGVFASGILAFRRWEQGAPSRRRWLAAAAAWAFAFSFFLVPFVFPLINPTYLGHVSGLEILLTAKCGVNVLTACSLTAYAQMGDRAVRRGKVLWENVRWPDRPVAA